jgi:mono/diheme cytochrome c family protein
LRQVALVIGFALAAWAVVPVRHTVPNVTLPGSGGNVRKLHDLASDRPVVVLHLPGKISVEECAALGKTGERLNGDNMATVAVLGGQCSAGSKVLMVRDDAVAGQLGFDATGGPQWGLLIVDTYAKARVTRNFSAGIAGLDESARTARTWELGRQTFQSSCARCHGLDGQDTSYSGIKTLGGISLRVPKSRFLTGGFVDTSGWTEAMRAAALTYMEGL